MSLSFHKYTIAISLIAYAFLSLAYESARAADPLSENYLIPHKVNDSNFDASLTWTESYRLEFLLKKYEVTDNVCPLWEFVERSLKVISVRDDNLPNAQPNSKPRWSHSIYIPGISFASAGSDGMIVYPFARFSWLVKNRNLQAITQNQATQRCPKSYETNSFSSLGAAANYLIERTIETLASHDPNLFQGNLTSDTEWNPVKLGYYFPRSVRDFCSSTQNNCATYTRPKQPYNLDHAMGRALLMTYLVTNNREILHRLRSLTNSFKLELNRSSANSKCFGAPRLGACDWPTWLYWENDFTEFEDISHGAIVVDFVYLSWLHGIDFEFTDIKMFSKLAMALVPSESSFFVKVNKDQPSNCIDDKCHEFNTFNELARDLSSYLAVLVGTSQPYDPNNMKVSETVKNIRKILERNPYVNSEDVDGVGLLARVNLNYFYRDLQYGQYCSTLGTIAKGDGACRTGSCYGLNWHTNIKGKGDAICGEPLGNGSSCKRDSECVTGSCFAGVVCGDRLGIGSSCYRDLECVSGRCDAGICK